jgi:hypothetical protein
MAIPSLTVGVRCERYTDTERRLLRRGCALALILFAGVASAQDERRVTSPNGQIEFRLFIATQPDNNLSRVAYEVLYRGKPLLKTSFMGLDIEAQEPLLGENVGLTSSSSAKSLQYNTLVAHYMQNGSLGRLIDVEARAYNDGVAFRYVIPPSTPLADYVILEEATEFRFGENIDQGSWVDIGPEAVYDLAFSMGIPSLGVMLRVTAAWVAISEAKRGAYPPIHLIRLNPTTDLTRLARPFQATAPLTCPWRIISIGATSKEALRTAILADLNR